MKLPEHKCGLFLQHNEHRDYYEDAEYYINQHKDQYEWKSEEHKKRAIETDEIWTLQWYPNTPIGFLAVAAPTLEELLEFANEDEDQQPTSE